MKRRSFLQMISASPLIGTFAEAKTIEETTSESTEGKEVDAETKERRKEMETLAQSIAMSNFRSMSGY